MNHEQLPPSVEAAIQKAAASKRFNTNSFGDAIKAAEHYERGMKEGARIALAGQPGEIAADLTAEMYTAVVRNTFPYHDSMHESSGLPEERRNAAAACAAIAQSKLSAQQQRIQSLEAENAKLQAFIDRKFSPGAQQRAALSTPTPEPQPSFIAPTVAPPAAAIEYPANCLPPSTQPTPPATTDAAERRFPLPEHRLPILRAMRPLYGAGGHDRPLCCHGRFPARGRQVRALHFKPTQRTRTMKLQDQVVPLPLAKRLKELGIGPHGQFFYDRNENLYIVHPAGFPDRLRLSDLTRHNGTTVGDFFPAFTVAELGLMLGPFHCKHAAGHPEAAQRAARLILLLESSQLTPDEVNQRLAA